MKVTFIYPALPLEGFNKGACDILLRHIHHGLASLSSCVKKEGFDADLVELRLFDGWDAFRAKIESADFDAAAVTMMSPDHFHALKCIDIIKEAKPKAAVVVGGIHPTIMPEKLASNSRIDYVVRGEGEATLAKLLHGIEDGIRSEKILQGEIFDIDSMPFTDRHLFDCLESPWDFFFPLPFFTIMAGRGCSYNCKFCAPASKMVHGKGARRRGVKSVIEELKLLAGRYGMRSFMFHDDCFAEDKDWVMEFCAAYKREGFTQEFLCQMRADIICKYPEMMKKLSSCGLRMALIGFESGNDRILKFISKGTTVKQNLTAGRICKANGIRIFANHMFGLPTETSEEMRDTVRMIQKIKPYRPSPYFFTPHPGSYLYDYCKENGLSLIDDHDDLHTMPEDERPKIRGIDYDMVRRSAMESMKLSLGVRIMMRIDRLVPNRRNRRFLRIFRELERANPAMHKMDILSLMKSERYA